MSFGATSESDAVEVWLRRTLAARFDRVLDEDLPDELRMLVEGSAG